MSVLFWLWRHAARRGWTCCLLAALLGVAGCRNPACGPRQSDLPAARDEIKAEKKTPPKDGSLDDSLLNSDRAKKISRDLDRTID
jgi:hypothetical protein